MASASTFDVRWYYLLGGVLGAAYVFMALMTVGTIGAGGVAAATITGQLTMSVVIDRLGVLGLDRAADHGQPRGRCRAVARRDLSDRSLARRDSGGDWDAGVAGGWQRRRPFANDGWAIRR